MKARDRRNKCSTDIVNTIHHIKANAFEDYFYRKVNEIRTFELSKLRNQNVGWALSITMMWLGPGLILSATFFMYHLLGKTITAAKAFEVILVFSVLNFSIKQLPDSINSLLQIWVSIKRIEKFLLHPVPSRDHLERDDTLRCAVSITRGAFSWEIKQEDK
jgi:hypothetical protein